MRCNTCFNACYQTWSGFFQDLFERIGVLIAEHPKSLIVFCIVVTAFISSWMTNLTRETNTEILYTPVNSRASQDRVKYQATFPDATGSYYVGHALTTGDMYGKIIFSAVDGNVFSNSSMEEIRRHISSIKAITASNDDGMISYNDICAVRNGACYLSGESLTTNDVMTSYAAGNLTLPDYNGESLTQVLGKVNVTGHQLLSAKYMKITFHLRQNTKASKGMAKAWEDEFLKTVQTLKTSATAINYASSQSLDVELNKNIAGDIVFLSITFTLMITYATVTAGGDVVSSRTWAAWAGVLAAGFGILSSFGLISLCGVKFVNIVGVMPFLIIGIGVDDMFLLMSSWAETYSENDEGVTRRIGRTFRSAGIGITITSITDLLAFAIGASSVFISVRNFCIYTGVAVIFTYLYQCCFFGSCLTLHGRRVNERRHCVTCHISRSREELARDGNSRCTVWCCGGSPPTRRGQDERCVETIPRKYLPRMLLNGFGYVLVFATFLAYLGVSTWGIINFKQGLELKNLVSPASYYHTYAETDDSNFNSIFPVPFVFESGTDYIDFDTLERFKSLFESAESDTEINSDSLICWYYSYKATSLYDNKTLANFITGLRTFIDAVPMFKNDVIFDSSNSTVMGSRCYLFSTDIKDSNAQADLMLRMRSLADSSPLSVYVFHPAYIYFEQYVAILPNTLQTVGITLAVMTIITFIFLPHPLLVLLVVLNIVSILVGIFGFLHIWGLTLSSVTMIHLIMSVGFSVDFSVHVCSAYMLGEGETRQKKVEAAITHAAGPILNGGISSFLGIIVLLGSKSYIFNSFFKIMFTVILFGMLHAVVFLPVILRLCGPLSRSRVSQSPHIAIPSTPRMSAEQAVPVRQNDAYNEVVSNGLDTQSSRNLSESVSDEQVEQARHNDPNSEAVSNILDTHKSSNLNQSISVGYVEQARHNVKPATSNLNQSVSVGQVKPARANDPDSEVVCNGLDMQTSSNLNQSISVGQVEPARPNDPNSDTVSNSLDTKA